MLNIELIAYLGVLQSVLLTCALMALPEGNRVSNCLLAALLMASACYLLASGLAGRPGMQAYNPSLLSAWISLLFGPLLWFYVSSVCHAEFSLSGRHWLHFLPALLCLLLLLYAGTGVSPSSERSNELGALIAVFLILSLVAYSVMSLRELSEFQRDLTQVVSSVEWSYITWLRLFIGAIFAYIVFGTIGEVFWELEVAPLMGQGLRIAVFNYLLCYLVVAEAIFHPEIFSKRYRELLLLKSQGLTGQDSSDSGESQESKYQRSGLTEQAANEYWLAVQQQLESDQSYLQSDLRISTLAQSMGVSVNHLSQAINVSGGESFYDLVNDYRVNHAKTLLDNSANDYKSVLDIALDAGFNSQSAFYKAFKRVEDMTPARYRKSQRA